MTHMVIGELHGHLNDFRRLLVAHSLCDSQDLARWAGFCL